MYSFNVAYITYSFNVAYGYHLLVDYCVYNIRFNHDFNKKLTYLN